MQIYIYSESCTRGGHVYRGEDPEENGDLFMWGVGPEDQLIEEARRNLDNETPFSRRCARNVLDYLGASHG